MLEVNNIHLLDERLSLRFILSIFPWFDDVSSSGSRFPSFIDGMESGCFSKFSFFPDKQKKLGSYFH